MDSLDLTEGGPPGGEGNVAQSRVVLLDRRGLAGEDETAVVADGSQEDQLAGGKVRGPRL